MNNGGLVFLSWTPAHGRSSGLARALGATELFVGERNYQPRSAPARYLSNTRVTWRVLERTRPAGVLVMMPPLPALVVAMLWGWRRGAFVVIDAHTGVFNDPRWRWALRPTLRLARRARATIVTNEPLAAIVRAAGATAYVLHNAPDDHQPEAIGGGGVLIPCSWAADEPIEEMLQAVRGLGVLVTVTGSPRPDVPRRHPSVTFTGYVGEAEYAELLHHCDVVLAMTTRQETMQQAGYEALARHIPLVTSDTRVLRDYFAEGATFAEPQAKAIRVALESALAAQDALREGMRRNHALRAAEWELDLLALKAVISG